MKRHLAFFLEETQVLWYLSAMALKSAPWSFQASADAVIVTSHIIHVT